MVDFVAFDMLVSDMVFADGHVALGVPGGGGPEAAYGMCLFADRVGLAARVGSDLPEEVLSWLAEAKIDAGGLKMTGVPTVRGWTLPDEDGYTFVSRLSRPEMRHQFRRSVADLPEGYRTARGYHIGFDPNEPDTAFLFIQDLRQALSGSPIISIETFKPAQQPIANPIILELMSNVDIFSTNWKEARSLIGSDNQDDALEYFVLAGARVVVIRLGPEGSLVADTSSNKSWLIPAFATEVVDTIGAGNAFCGAFLVGYSDTNDALKAGLYGAAAASLLIEQVGLPIPNRQARDEALRRLEELRPLVRAR